MDPKKGLAKGLLKKGTETAVDIGSYWWRDIGYGIKVLVLHLYRLGRSIASNRWVKGAALLGAAPIYDLARPKGKSFGQRTC